MNSLLLLIAVTLIVSVYLAFLAYMDAKRRHDELMGLLNDLATMLGELFEQKNKE